MRPLSQVQCATCNQTYLKPIHHVKENLKFGHRFFCSTSCQSKLKNKYILLHCKNPNCQNQFKRLPSGISDHNFCSKSCAVIINNQKRIRQKLFKTCKNLNCNNMFLGEKKYCSRSCRPNKGNPPIPKSYTKEELLSRLRKIAKILGRTPTRRECTQARSCQKYFGSWNNAIIAADLTPHRSKSQKMYKRVQTYAKDGHYCYSISEVLIDNWLKNHGFNHQKEVPYPENKFIADWLIPDKKIFIEYFGLANDVENYDLTIEKKRVICKNFGIKLIELYAQDLFPNRNLDNRLDSLNFTN